MKINLASLSPTKIQCDLLVVNLFEGTKKLSGVSAAVAQLVHQDEAKGALGKVTLIHTQGKLPAKRIAVVGLGKQADFGLDEIRIAAAAVIKTAKDIGIKKVASIVHGAEIGSIDVQDAAQALVEGTILGAYEFNGYKTGKSKIENRKSKIGEFIIIEKDAKKVKKIKEGARVGEILAVAANSARDLVNAPANKMTPSIFAGYAKKAAKRAGLKCTVLDPKTKGMHSIMAVAAGSSEPAKVVVLASRISRPTSRAALIGKGITFDSGGISIKPSRKLWQMKTDMAGAAAVLEAMLAFAKLKIKKDVIAVIPLCENMPDGSSTKPGDVVSSLSGITTEIISTDAEGRMILADAITYAKKLGAREIVDCATLTGGCVTALGDVASAVIGNDQKVVDKLKAASEKSGEKLWQMPLYKEYQDYLKSKIADHKNCTEGKGASPSTGATYLHKYVGDTPWAHLDIAGTAYLSDQGATGVPLRTLVEYLRA